MNENQKTYLRRRRWLSGISLATITVLAVFLTVFVWNWLSSFSQDDFRAYIHSFGVMGWFVLLGLQFLQVFIALIPGELLESAAGYAFGPYMGTLLCYIGVALASGLVFLLVRRFGVGLVETFVSREKINQLRFVNTEKKRNGLIFLLFLIPGTPKDLLTYFAGLTDIKLGAFLILSLTARLPSVISSTFGGHLLGEGQYWSALLLYGITGAVSIAGLLLYNHILQKKKSNEA